MARLRSLLRVNPQAALSVDPLPSPSGLRAQPLDLDDERAVQLWCDHYAITEAALREAVAAVGLMPAALMAHFASRGSSTRKKVTPQMRAAAALRPRRKSRAKKRPSADSGTLGTT
jgi:Protein of unknown function (DUF3606)